MVWTELSWEFHVVEMECVLWTSALSREGGQAQSEHLQGSFVQIGRAHV